MSNAKHIQCRRRSLAWTGAVPILALLFGGCGLTGSSDDSVASRNHAGIVLPPLPGLDGGTSGGNDGGGTPGTGLVLDQSLLFFGQVCPGQTASRSATVRNTGTGNIQVRNLSISPSAFALVNEPSLPLLLRPGNSSTLNISLTPPVNNPPANFQINGDLLISSNDRLHGTLDLKLTGFVPPATLALSPRTIDFGDQLVGDVTTTSLTMSNPGMCPTTVSGFEVSGGSSNQVSVSNLPGNPINQGGSARVNVTLSCTSAGDVNVTLRFTDPQGRSIASANVIGSCFDF